MVLSLPLPSLAKAGAVVRMVPTDTSGAGTGNVQVTQTPSHFLLKINNFKKLFKKSNWKTNINVLFALLLEVARAQLNYLS